MTKTKAQTSIEPATTPDGRPGYRIECRCSTHPEGKTAAIVLDHGKPMPASYIHGTVLGAHHPARTVRDGLRVKGIWAAEA